MPVRNMIFKNGCYYHAYNRGVSKNDIFYRTCDYDRFLKKAKYYSGKFGVSILSYALMNNHFHFFVRQDRDDGIKNFLQKLQQSHSLYFNIKYGREGALFESRFKAKEVAKEDYFFEIQKYIANNPFKVKVSSEKGVASSGLNLRG